MQPRVGEDPEAVVRSLSGMRGAAVGLANSPATWMKTYSLPFSGGASHQDTRAAVPAIRRK